MLVTRWRKGNSHTLLVGMKMHTAIWGDVTELFQKPKNSRIKQSWNPTAGSTPEGNQIHLLKRYLHPHAYCTTIHHGQGTETTSESTQRWTDEETELCTDKILLIKIWILITHNNVDGTGDHYVKQARSRKISDTQSLTCWVKKKKNRWSHRR